MSMTGIISGVRSSQSYVAAQLKPDIERALFLLEPYQTPFLQFLFFSAGVKQKKVINKTGKFSWFEDEYFPHQAARPRRPLVGYAVEGVRALSPDAHDAAPAQNGQMLGKVWGRHSKSVRQ